MVEGLNSNIRDTGTGMEIGAEDIASLSKCTS
jgi:hypothetical protein